MSAPPWRPGNRVTLLENGEQYFPRVLEAIASARKEVFVETFILFDDPVGREVRSALIAAARRGVRVELTVDGYGSHGLSAGFVMGMTSAGVRYHVFDPHPPSFGFRTNIFRRFHRKIVVVDGRVAFVGGINFSEDHLLSFGPEAKQDFAVEIVGPVVDDVRRAAEATVAPPPRRRFPWRRPAAEIATASIARAGGADAILVVRDNEEHRAGIEPHYIAGIRDARREITIANAYFFPGYRLLRSLRKAAERGVRVRLMLQGKPDKPEVRWASRFLYEDLLRAGAEIHEYCARPLHGKVAVVDGEWSTVGSSNLDPLSLFLNLEADLLVRSRDFGAQLQRRLDTLIAEDCEQVQPQEGAWPRLWQHPLRTLAYHAARRFPAWAGWLPGHGVQARRPAATGERLAGDEHRRDAA